jgi:hypothetical protein
MQRSKSPKQAQDFLSAHALSTNNFVPVPAGTNLQPHLSSDPVGRFQDLASGDVHPAWQAYRQPVATREQCPVHTRNNASESPKGHRTIL